MHEAVAEFVERMALTLESEGLPRIAGRLVGFLLVHPDAYSLDELAEHLQVSKASISTNARQLEEHGILQRISTPGDRRDYYRMTPDAWEGMLRAAQQKWNAMRMMLTAGAASLPDEMETARARVIEAEQFYLLMLDGVERMIERWGRRQTGLGTERSAGAEQPRYDASPAGASEET
jgi:DNA-binding MarR family transcriptional regulator